MVAVPSSTLGLSRHEFSSSFFPFLMEDEIKRLMLLFHVEYFFWVPVYKINSKTRIKR